MTKLPTTNIDAELESLATDLAAFASDGDETGSFSDRRRAITLWVPIDYADRYEKIQKMCKRKFSKKLQNLAMKAIDIVMPTRAA